MFCWIFLSRMCSANISCPFFFFFLFLFQLSRPSGSRGALRSKKGKGARGRKNFFTATRLSRTGR